MRKKPVAVYLDERDIQLLKRRAGRKKLSQYVRELIYVGLNRQKTLFQPQPIFSEEFIDSLAEKLASRLTILAEGQVKPTLTKRRIERKLEKDEVKRLLLEELKQVFARRRGEK